MSTKTQHSANLIIYSVPQLGPRTEKRDTFTRLLWLFDEGHHEGVRMVRVNIEDAKRLIREASQLKKFVDIYVNSGGALEIRQSEVKVPFLDSDLPALLKSLDIVPRHRWRPSVTEYSGLATDDIQYTVTAGEMGRIAEAFGVRVDLGAVSVREPSAIDHESVATTTETTPKRTKWRDAVWPHMIEVLKTGRFSTAKELYKALEHAVGSPGSPFEKQNNQLFIPAFGQSVSLKTLQNDWTNLRRKAGLL